MLYTLLLAACSGTTGDTADTEAPTIEILSPAEGDTFTAGADIAVSVVVDGFTLEAPSKHNDGAPEGYLSVTVDGTEVLTTADIGFTVNIADAGAHTIGVELLYADGDPLDPAVDAEVSVTIE